MQRAIYIAPANTVQKQFGEVLVSRGWELEYYDGHDGLTQALALGPAQLILCAASLAEGSYSDVIQEIRSRMELAATPIILVCTDPSPEAKFKALELGITELFGIDQLDNFNSYLSTLEQDSATAACGGRALVLDDSPIITAYISRVLEGMGLAVDSAISVDDALGAVLTHNYDLIVTDIVLGDGQSGNYFIRLLRQSVGQAVRTPIIAISGYQDQARKLDALRAGANVFLTKPLNESLLVFFAHKLLTQPTPSESDDTSHTYPQRPGHAGDLSEREYAICTLAVAGHPDKRIAQQLGISYWTVRSHMTSIFRKCGVMNRVELANLLRSGRHSVAAETGQAQAAVFEWLSLASHVLDRFQYGVMVTDKNDTILHINPAFTRISGYRLKDVRGKTPKLLFSSKHPDSFHNDILDTLNREQSWCGEVWNRHADGHIYLAWLDIRQLGAEAPMGAHYVAVLSDITERRQEIERIYRSALYDPLTGLANRTLLQDRGQQAIAHARRQESKLGVLFIDLDRFKAVNDAWGHGTGDVLLVQITERIKASFRTDDTLARFGGDEFVALLPNLTDRQTAEVLADKLLGVLKAPVSFVERSFHVGASIGISIFPDDGDNLETLIAAADTAMYQAKGAGGNCIRHYSTPTAAQGQDEDDTEISACP